MQAQTPVFRSHELIRWNNSIKVNALLQDQDGFIWIGTSEGLFRYDGYAFLPFTQENGLAEKEVTALYQHLDGTLWIGHQSGAISHLAQGKATTFEPEEGTPSVAIHDFAYDPTGKIWIATNGEGIYYYELANQRLYIFTVDEGLSDNVTYDLEVDQNGYLWAGTDGGVTIYHKEKNEITIINDQNGLPDNIVQVIRKDKAGFMWLGMQSAGLAKVAISDRVLQSQSVNTEWSYGAITDLLFLKDECWIATQRKGILIFNQAEGRLSQHFNRQNGLEQERILTLMADQESNIWVGSQTGVTQTVGDFVRFLKPAIHQKPANVLSLCQDAQARLWYVTEQGVFVHYTNEFGDDVTGNFLEQYPQLANNYFVSIAAGPQGMIWLGTYGKGLLRIDPKSGKFKWFTTQNGLVNGNVLHLSPTENALWISTLEGVQKAVLTPETENIDSDLLFETIGKEQGLESSYVYSTFTDSKNRTWIATDGGGLAYWQDGQLTPFLLKDGLPSQTIYAVTEDQSANIWFSALNAGVYYYNGTEVKTFNTQNGLRDNFVNALSLGANGHILAMHRSGIDAIDPKTGTIIYLGQEVGLEKQDINLNSVFRSKQGHVLVGTSDGIVIFDNDLTDLERQPKMVIQGVNLFDEPLPLSQEASLSYKQNNLTFLFSGIWLRAPQNVSYEYQLKNYDREWLGTQNRQVTYSQLPPGKFTFLVRASHGQGFATAEIKTFEFEIIPPLWQRAWFLILCAVALSFMVFGFIKLREQRLRETQLELERQVEERTEELREQRDETEKKNQQITSSIQYARRIQQAILPSVELIEQQLPGTVIFFRPRDVVSGDFYWYLKKQNRQFIVAADCTGHGVPGALMSMLGCELLEKIVSELRLFSVDLILKELHLQIRKLLRQDETQNRDGMDLSLCMIDLDNQIVEYAGAKNPLVYFRDQEIFRIKGDAMPIGGLQLEKERTFTRHQIPLKGTTHFYLFSDGFQDQFGGADGRKFMATNFRNLLHKLHTLPARQQVEHLEETLQNWKGTERQTDDILVLGFKIVAKAV